MIEKMFIGRGSLLRLKLEKAVGAVSGPTYMRLPVGGGGIVVGESTAIFQDTCRYSFVEPKRCA